MPRTTAQKLLDFARASDRGRRMGIATTKTERGEVIVAWDRIEHRYEVGNAAQNLATGKRGEVLATLEKLLGA